MKLTEHFTLSEMTSSRTAIARKIDNTPTPQAVINLAALCALVLEPLRQAAARPLVITSGYRCPQLNEAVGGVPTSAHLSGRAADIRVNSRADGLHLCDLLAINPYLDIALFEHSGSSSWLHVQISATPRQYINRNYVV